jgi:hypothetical protein
MLHLQCPNCARLWVTDTRVRPTAPDIDDIDAA